MSWAFGQEGKMDRNLQSMFAVMVELEQAGLETLANAAQLLGELTRRYGERSTRELLNIACRTTPSGASEQRELDATELINEYRAYVRELAASSSWLSMDFFNNLEEARARRRRSVPSHSAD
jgi:hypothetical protein